jgi:hypothetical protein
MSMVEVDIIKYLPVQYSHRNQTKAEQPVSNLPADGFSQIVTVSIAPILFLLFWIMLMWLSDNVLFKVKDND